MSWRGVTVAAREVARRLQFRGNLGAAASTNSGGNQQKLVIGKWVLSNADVLIFDEPTRGIDVGAKAEIYRLIHELAGAGRAVIVVSSEIMELVNLCHRIVVMSGGRIYDEMNADEFDDRRILDAAFAAHVSVPGSLSERFVRAIGTPDVNRDEQKRMHDSSRIEIGRTDRRERLTDLARRYGREIGLPAVVIILMAIFGFTSDVFLTTQNLRNIGVAAAALAAVSFGQTFVVLTAGLDLSVGSTVALVSVVAAYGIRSHGIALGVAEGIFAGTCVGIVNGLVITKLNVFPFIATLAMLSILSGLALNLSGGIPISGLPGSLWRFRLRSGVGIARALHRGAGRSGRLTPDSAIHPLRASHLRRRRQSGSRAAFGNRNQSGQGPRLRILQFLCRRRIDRPHGTCRLGTTYLGRELAARVCRGCRPRWRFAVRRARIGDRGRFRSGVREHPVERAQSSECFVLHADDGHRRRVDTRGGDGSDFCTTAKQ